MDQEENDNREELLLTVLGFFLINFDQRNMYLGWNDTTICLCKCYYYTCESGPTVVLQTRKVAAIKRRIKRKM